MKNKTTAIWFVLAASLAAFIWIFEHHFQPPAPGNAGLLPGLRAAAATSLQVIPAGAREISAARTNGAWLLQKPVAYPAQAARIETLLAVLEKLAPATRLTAGELRGHKNADAEFGFENPQFSIAVEAGEQRWQLLVGNKTAPGDQVFVRVVGVDGAFVTGIDWLQHLPRSATDWRDTALVDASGACDWIVITNGTKVIELRCDPTNHLWSLTRPWPARADGPRIAAALQQLRSVRVTQFVSDDPKADLADFGLQPAELDVWFGRGTNFQSAVHAGKSPAENPAQIFARREGWNSVVAVANDAMTPWHGAVNDFRDPHLLTLTAPVAEIEVRGENTFTLQQRGSNAWAVGGEKFSADAENVTNFLKLLTSFRVAEFVKDFNTAADLQGFGLTNPPSRQIMLRAVAGDTNAALAQLLFGATETNRVFVKRADEKFVYALAAEDFNRLPENGWEFRDRRIWSFTETNVAQVTLHQGGKTRQMLRSGANKWSLAPGSQGIINPPAVEETVHRLGELTAAGWIGRNVTAPEKFGLNTNNLSIAVELKTGEKLTVDFGAEVSQTALAAVTLDGERWAFVFPAALYQLVAAYLTIPPNTP